MAHEMNSNDIQHGIEMAWHKLTTIKTAEALRADGFPFEYVRSPLTVDGKAVDTHYLIQGSDDRKLIGDPRKESFGFLTNEQFMNVVRETLKGTGATIASLGTFMGRSKRYVSIKVGSEWDEFKVANRTFKNYLNLQDALDGTMPLIGKASNVCQVCKNTFNMSLLEQSDFKVSIRHTSKHGSAENIANFQQAIDAYHGASALFKMLMETAEETPVTPTEARLAFAGYLGEGLEMATRTANTVNRLTTLFSSGAGNRGATGADLLNAVTDFYSHESSGKRGEVAQLTSSEVGTGAKAKIEFFESVSVNEYANGAKASRTGWRFDRGNLDSLIAAGEKSLVFSSLS
jgi:hypothetical protein